MRALFAARGTAADAAVAVDQVRLAPQLAFPFRGLLQQVMPGDPVVVRRLETAVIAIEWGAAYRLVHVADQAAVDGEAGQDRQIALGDAEGQIDLRRVAPLGDDHGRRARPARSGRRAAAPGPASRSTAAPRRNRSRPCVPDRGSTASRARRQSARRRRCGGSRPAALGVGWRSQSGWRRREIGHRVRSFSEGAEAGLIFGESARLGSHRGAAAR